MPSPIERKRYWRLLSEVADRVEQGTSDAGAVDDRSSYWSRIADVADRVDAGRSVDAAAQSPGSGARTMQSPDGLRAYVAAAMTSLASEGEVAREVVDRVCETLVQVGFSVFRPDSAWSADAGSVAAAERHLWRTDLLVVVGGDSMRTGRLLGLAVAQMVEAVVVEDRSDASTASVAKSKLVDALHVGAIDVTSLREFLVAAESRLLERARVRRVQQALVAEAQELIDAAARDLHPGGELTADVKRLLSSPEAFAAAPLREVQALMADLGLDTARLFGSSHGTSSGLTSIDADEFDALVRAAEELNWATGSMLYTCSAAASIRDEALGTVERRRFRLTSVADWRRLAENLPVGVNY